MPKTEIRNGKVQANGGVLTFGNGESLNQESTEGNSNEVSKLQTLTAAAKKTQQQQQHRD
ncbi:hypothetical protein A2U01_0091392 [Trifolium medium]|uniref:Uncharacterized protein n=1 Tax=Trifolium medium TaxID=97028 RepID=A0A392U9E7_9FABA|nr:hypothetical protein [Trifolium medium]